MTGRRGSDEGAPEQIGFGRKEGAGTGDFAGAGRAVRRRNLREVVEVVEEHVTESGGHRVDVARQGEIEQNQRPSRPIGHRGRNVVGRKHGARRGRGPDDDVETG